MDYICACLLLFLWFVRPQDIFTIIGGVSVVKYLMYAGLFATVRRPLGFSFQKVFATPMDWLAVIYCLWAIYATPTHMDAAKEVFTYFSFHMVVALALSDWRRIEVFINHWLGCLAILAVLAVSTHWGFELVKGSAELTAVFHDRLTLNTWVFRNPNALGHGVLALIPAGIAWYVMAGGKNKALGIAMIVLAVHCVLLTESKGAFLAGAGGLTLLFLFKRPVWFQLVMLALMWGGGLAVLKTLPRMNTLSKDDEGIQGRMIVWQQAKGSMEATKTGEGLKAFHGYVELRVARLHRTVRIPIATHGSYVRNGADLGYVGLMLFTGIFYGGARLLLQAQTAADSEARRVQRTIYALVTTTAVSCWVVDRAYHMDYFLLTGLLSAFHRRFLPPEKLSEDGDVETDTSKAVKGKLPAAAKTPALALALPSSAVPEPETASKPGTATEGGPVALEQATTTAPKPVSTALALNKPRPVPSVRSDEAPADNTTPEGDGVIKLKWNRLDIIDLVAMYALLEVVLYYWDLFSTDFIVF